MSAGEDVEMGELRLRVASLKKLLASQPMREIEMPSDNEGGGSDDDAPAAAAHDSEARRLQALIDHLSVEDGAF